MIPSPRSSSSNIGTSDHPLKQELYRRVGESSEIFEFIQCNILDGLWYWDLENPEHEWHNDRFGEVFGYQPHEIPNSPDFCREHCFEEDFAEAVKNLEAHCADSSHPYSQDLRYRHRDGSTVWVRCRGFAIRDANGKAIRMLGANTDITELKQVEEQLERNRQKLSLALKTTTDIQDRLVNAERLKALGQMSSSIAHEFNNLLAKMQGLLQDVKPANGAHESTVQQLEDLVDEGSNIVRSLGNFHPDRPSSERVKEVCLANLIDDTVKLTRPHWKAELSARGTDVSIESRVPRDLNVQVDPAQFREVLTNLIFNACDAFDDHGTLKFSAKTGRHSIVVEVTDDGCGMTPETLERCRDTFYSTKGENSTGLGLALSETIVRGFGGELKVKSEPERGTTVAIHLPKPSESRQPDNDLSEGVRNLTATTKGDPPKRYQRAGVPALAGHCAHGHGRGGGGGPRVGGRRGTHPAFCAPGGARA